MIVPPRCEPLGVFEQFCRKASDNKAKDTVATPRFLKVDAMFIDKVDRITRVSNAQQNARYGAS